MSKYLILDGHSLAYRAYFALSNSGLRDDNNNETHAIHGFYSMLAKLLDEIEPAGIAVAFDRPEPTFRDKLDPCYKDGRLETPQSLIFQVEAIKEIASALNIFTIEYPGYEADDLIATIATRAAEEERNALIVTGDRDSFQLVNDPYIEVLYLMHGVSEYGIYNEAKIKERTGVEPKYYPTLASLRGDPSDNLPGVAGIGPKTAAKLINEYGGLDEIYNHLDKYNPKQREALLFSKERVYLNLEMTVAVRNIPLDFTFDELRLGYENRQLLEDLFDKYKIRKTRDRIFKILDTKYSVGQSASKSRETGIEKDQHQEELDTAKNSPITNLEFTDETPVLKVLESPTNEQIVDFLNTFQSENNLYILLPQKDAPSKSSSLIMTVLSIAEKSMSNFSPVKEQFFKKYVGDISDNHPWEKHYIDDLLDKENIINDVLMIDLDSITDPKVRERLASFFAGNNYCITYKAKEVIKSLLNSGMAINNVIFDISLAGYLLDADIGQADLSALSDRFLGKGRRDEKSLQTQEGQLEFALPSDRDETSALISSYILTIVRLGKVLASTLKAVCGLVLLHEIEIPLAFVLAKMEFYGIAVDELKLDAIRTDLEREISAVEERVFQLTGESFNLNSPKQLGEVLYKKLGLLPAKKTKGKTSFSTDAATLEKLKGEHPAIYFILRYRELEKLRSTYAIGLMKEIGPDHRIHATFHQTIARTGRLSSDRPNLHNIPMRTESGKRFREVFVSGNGSLLLVADYNQIELRIIAHLSKDPGLIQAFSQNIDIHTATAARVYGIDIEEVTPEMRQKAKMVSYGLIYGMEAYGLAQRLGIEVGEAKQILDSYFKAFPGVKKYMTDTISLAKATGYTETLLNRRRYLADLDSHIYSIRQAAERQAMNAGVQGLAADIFKIALVNLDHKINDLDLKSRIVLQVHDEIIMEVPLDEQDLVLAHCLDEMKNAVSLDVALEVNIGWGHTWAQAKEK